MSQKIPLFLGRIEALRNGDTTALPTPLAPPGNLVFAPPDVNLDRKNDPNNQLRHWYELHLWIVPFYPGLLALQEYTVEAFDVNNPAAPGTTIWAGESTAAVSPLGKPFKVLDGYPVRGSVGVRIFADLQGKGLDLYPLGAQAYGYYTIAGGESQLDVSRRFVPEADGVDQGAPLVIPAGGAGQEALLHTFAQNRYDEMELGFSLPAPAATTALMGLRQVDAAGNDIIPGQIVPCSIPPSTLNASNDPPGPYQFSGLVLGPNPLNPNLSQLIFRSQAAIGDDVSAHGVFVRH